MRRHPSSIERRSVASAGRSSGTPAASRFVTTASAWLLVCALLTSTALAATIPEPPPRPPEFGGVDPGLVEPGLVEPAPQAAPAPRQPDVPMAAARQGAADCLSRLKAFGWTAEPAAQPNPDRAECTVPEPVRLVRLSVPEAARGAILFPDKPVVACRFAEPFGRWVSGIVAPVAAAKLGSPLAALLTGPGTECRTRDRIVGAKMSAHGLGIAIDVAAFEMADGRLLPVKPSPAAAPAWVATFAAIRIASCGWFTTVLGPGSDAYHSDHLHLDIQQHGSSDRYRICQ